MNRQQYLDIIHPAIDIVIKKGEDYNAGPRLEQYFPFGDFSYIQMIHLKALRLVSLVENLDPNYESKEDTIYDLINYCVFYLDHLNQVQQNIGKPDAHV